MNARRLLKILAGFLALAALADSCSPGITVNNETTFAVRAIVRTGDKLQTASPAPGGSAYVEGQPGPYTVTIIPDDDWLKYAQLVRKDLNEQLANSQNLSGEKVLQLVTRLKDIAAKMKAFQDAGVGTSCSATITNEGGHGEVTVKTLANGEFYVTCK